MLELIQLLSAEVTFEFYFDLIDNMLFKAYARVTYFLCLLVALADSLISCLYLACKQLDLFENAAVEFLHEELPVLVVTEGLMSVNAYGVCQFGNVVCPLSINASQLHIFLQKALSNAF